MGAAPSSPHGPRGKAHRLEGSVSMSRRLFILLRSFFLSGAEGGTQTRAWASAGPAPGPPARPPPSFLSILLIIRRRGSMYKGWLDRTVITTTHSCLLRDSNHCACKGYLLLSHDNLVRKVLLLVPMMLTKKTKAWRSERFPSWQVAVRDQRLPSPALKHELSGSAPVPSPKGWVCVTGHPAPRFPR